MPVAASTLATRHRRCRVSATGSACRRSTRGRGRAARKVDARRRVVDVVEGQRARRLREGGTRPDSRPTRTATPTRMQCSLTGIGRGPANGRSRRSGQRTPAGRLVNGASGRVASGHDSDADVSGGGPHGDGLAVSGGVGRAPGAGRLRHVPGAEGAAAAQLGRPAGAAGVDRRCGADACPPGSRRHAAAAGRAGASRGASSARPAPRICVRWCCPMPDACRRRKPSAPTARATPGTARPSRSSPRTTPASRCRGCSPLGINDPFPWVAPGSRWSSYPRGHLLGAALRADAAHRRQRRHRALRRRPGTLQPAHPAGPLGGHRRRRAARRVHLRRPPAPGR